MASPRSSTTAAVVDVEDNTKARDEEDTGAVVAAVLAAEASSVDVDVAAVVTSGVVEVASAVLLAASRPPKAPMNHSLLCHFGFYEARKASLFWFGLPTSLPIGAFERNDQKNSFTAFVQPNLFTA